MHIRAEPDKQRFVDLKARSTDCLVHSVELSDRRSSKKFVTLYFKGRTPEIDGFISITGLRDDNHHDPKIYHRGDEKNRWIHDTFPDKGSAWTFHWHKRLTVHPKLADVEVYRPGVSDALWSEIEAHFKKGKRK